MSVELYYGALIRLIKERLIILGMTQTELAKRVGVSSPAISQIISKKKYPTLLTFLNIAQVLGLVVTYQITIPVEKTKSILGNIR